MKASIIIRAYNAENTIERTIKSAVNQNFPKEQFEIIIVNDGSVDTTREIIKKYESLPNVRIFNQENKGAVDAANSGIKASSGEYVVFLDSDDYFDSSFLREMLFVFEKEKECDAIYPDYYEELSGEKKLVSPASLFKVLLGGMLFHKRILIEEGGFSDKTIFPEYDLFLKTIGRRKYCHHSRALYTYIRHGESITAVKNRVVEALEYFRKTYPDKIDFINSIRSY